MLEITDHLRIPDDELAFQFARSGGPGGQNVNKVASKAVLHWNAASNQTIPQHVMQRLRTLQRRRFTNEGELVIISQRFRDQERNKQDCLEKLREMIIEASHVPKARRATKPTRGSRERRLQGKKHKATLKGMRRIED